MLSILLAGFMNNAESAFYPPGMHFSEDEYEQDRTVRVTREEPSQELDRAVTRLVREGEKEFEDLSEHDRALVERLVRPLLEDGSGSGRIGAGIIANYFKQIPINQRDSVVETFFRLKSPPRGFTSIHSCIDAIYTYMEPLQRGDIIGLVQELMDMTETSAINLSDFSQIFHKLPTLDDKRNFVGFFRNRNLSLWLQPSKLLPENYQLMNLMESLSNTPDNDEKENIVNWVEKIYGQTLSTMNGGYRNSSSFSLSAFLKELSTFSNNEDRDRVMASVLRPGLLSMVRSNILDANIYKVLQALKIVADDQARNDLLDFLLASGLISKGLGPDIFSKSFMGFSKLPPEERQQGFELFSNVGVVNPEMSMFDRSKIISSTVYSLFEHPVLARRGFFRQWVTITASFMTQETTIDDRQAILDLLGIKTDASWEEKELLVQCASQLCTATMSSHDRLVILQALATDRTSFLHPEVFQYRFEFASSYLHEV